MLKGISLLIIFAQGLLRFSARHLNSNCPGKVEGRLLTTTHGLVARPGFQVVRLLSARTRLAACFLKASTGKYTPVFSPFTSPKIGKSRCEQPHQSGGMPPQRHLVYRGTENPCKPRRHALDLETDIHPTFQITILIGIFISRDLITISIIIAFILYYPP